MFKLLSLFSALTILAAAAAENNSDYKGSQVWRITFNDDVQRQDFDSIDNQFGKFLLNHF